MPSGDPQPVQAHPSRSPDLCPGPLLEGVVTPLLNHAGQPPASSGEPSLYHPLASAQGLGMRSRPQLSLFLCPHESTRCRGQSLALCWTCGKRTVLLG